MALPGWENTTFAREKAGWNDDGLFLRRSEAMMSYTNMPNHAWHGCKSRHSPCCSMVHNIPMLSKFYLCARSAALNIIIQQQVKLHFPFFPSSSIWCCCCRCCVRSAIQPRQFLEGKAFCTILGNILRTK